MYYYINMWTQYRHARKCNVRHWTYNYCFHNTLHTRLHFVAIITLRKKLSVTSLNILYYDTMQSSRWLPVSWRNTLSSTTGQKVERVWLSKMLVVNNQETQCHKKEYHKMELHCCEILKFLWIYMIWQILYWTAFTADKFNKSYILRSKLYKLG